MNSLVLLSLTITVFIMINTCAAFTATHTARLLHVNNKGARGSMSMSMSMTMTMSMWGAQKLGQSVIGTTTVESPATQSTSWFRRAPVGSGCDDTNADAADDDDSEDSEMMRYKVMGNIDTSFKQHSLMMELTSNKWGSQEKLQRIQRAAADGLISPSTLSLSSSSSSSARASDMTAGGLMKDWNFDM